MAAFSPFWSDLGITPEKRPVRIGFADGTDPRVRAACARIAAFGIEPVLFGDKAAIQSALNAAPFAPVPTIGDQDPARLANFLTDRKARLSLDPGAIAAQASDSLYQALASLAWGEIDGVVAGARRPTADVVRASLHLIGARTGTKLVGGHFLIETETRRTADDTPFLFADCAVVPEPSPRALAAIAVSAAQSYRFFTKARPRVALLSFSTKGSAEHALVDRIRDAVGLARKSLDDGGIEGEIQADAAIDPDVALIKGVDDSLLGPGANVLIFPTLESGNIGYKLIQRFASTRIAGPILWGLARPVSDLSRGCTVDEIVDSACCVARMAVQSD